MENALRTIFQGHQKTQVNIVEKIEELAKVHGNCVYQAVFNYLLGRSFEAEEAQHYWREALTRWQHQKELRPGFLQVKVALLDYLEDVVGEKLGSMIDGLTGLFNNNYIRMEIDREIARSKFHTNSDQLTVVHLGLDHFDQLRQERNQQDLAQAQRHLGRLIKTRLREIDTAARVAEGQFALLLPSCNHNEAFARAERIRAAILNEPWQRLPFPEPFPTTVSSGIAHFPSDGQSSAVLCRVSRRHLELAQRNGNCTLPTKEERRRLTRHAFSSFLEIARTGELSFYPALARDVSINGIALECELNPGCGTTLQLRFKRPFWPVDREFSGTIRRAERHARSGIYRLALEFFQSEHQLVAQSLS